jgi:hypothetical protein
LQELCAFVDFLHEIEAEIDNHEATVRAARPRRFRGRRACHRKSMYPFTRLHKDGYLEVAIIILCIMMI